MQTVIIIVVLVALTLHLVGKYYYERVRLLAILYWCEVYCGRQPTDSENELYTRMVIQKMVNELLHRSPN